MTARAKLTTTAIVAVLISAMVLAQSKPSSKEANKGKPADSTGATTQSNDSERARSMFVNEQADGVEIKIKQHVEGKYQLINPGKAFQTGDIIRLEFRGNYQGYVYCINIPPAHETKVIHREAVKSVAGTFDVPHDRGIEFKNDTGTEILIVVMSKKPIPAFDEAIDKNNRAFGENAKKLLGELNKSKAKIPEPQKGGRQSAITKPVSIIDGDRCRGLELAIGGGVRCRGLELSLPGGKQTAERKDEGTVIAVIDRLGSKLVDHDFAVFEFYLEHKPR